MRRHVQSLVVAEDREVGEKDGDAENLRGDEGHDGGGGGDDGGDDDGLSQGRFNEERELSLRCWVNAGFSLF